MIRDMITPRFRKKITDALGIDKLDFGRVHTFDENGNIIGHLDITSYIMMQIRYRFGQVTIVIIETSEGWRVGLLMRKISDELLDKPEEIFEYVIVDRVELPILEYLKGFNLYPLDPKEQQTYSEEGLFMCIAEIHKYSIMSDMLIRANVNEEMHKGLWHSLQMTIIDILKLCNTDNTRRFLEKNRKHLDFEGDISHE